MMDDVTALRLARDIHGWIAAERARATENLAELERIYGFHVGTYPAGGNIESSMIREKIRLDELDMIEAALRAPAPGGA